MKRKLNVVAERNSNSCLTASVPSLPGCHTHTETLEQLWQHVYEVVELHAKRVFRIVISELPKPSLILLSFAVFLTNASCYSVSYPKPSEVERELARAFIPPPGKALIVAYRNPSIAPFSRNVPTRLWIDDEPYGGNKAGTFVVVPISKGLHRVGITGRPDATLNDQVFMVNASAGNVYFFRQHVDNAVSETMLVPAGGVPAPAPVASMRIYTRRVSEAEGRNEVAKCVQSGSAGKLSVSTWP